MPTTINDSLNGPCATCASPSPIAATFAVCTACPKKSSGATSCFCRRANCLVRGDSRLAGAFVRPGVTKIRMTGGEPLVRRDVEKLVGMLAPLPGLRDLTLTTNGALLAKKAAVLRDAGLRRVTVSLDSLDDATFKAMNDVDFPVARVLGRHRGRSRRRYGADQSQHGRQARTQR